MNGGVNKVLPERPLTGQRPRSSLLREGPRLISGIDRQSPADPLRHTSLEDRDIGIAQLCRRTRGGLAERSADPAAVED